MKKYIKPVSKIVEVNSEALLVGSPTTYNEVSLHGETYGKGMDDDWDEEDF